MGHTESLPMPAGVQQLCQLNLVEIMWLFCYAFCSFGHFSFNPKLWSQAGTQEYQLQFPELASNQPCCRKKPLEYRFSLHISLRNKIWKTNNSFPFFFLSLFFLFLNPHDFITQTEEFRALEMLPSGVQVVMFLNDYQEKLQDHLKECQKWKEWRDKLVN